MGIKHFVVKVKNIKYKEKGLRNMLKYLTDEKRHPDGIINYPKFKGEQFFLNVCNTIDKNEKIKLFKGKGGRKVESYADSYVFSFPPSLKNELTNEKIKEITEKMTVKLFNLFNSILESEKGEKIDLKTFLKYIFVNVHTNDHTHINIIFGRVFEIKENTFLTNRITNRKKFIELSKYAFDEIIDQEFELKKELYNAKPTNLKKGYKSCHLKKQMNELDEKITELKEEEEKVESKILELDELMKLKRSERKKEIEKLEVENDRRDKILNDFGLVVRYFNSYMKKVQNNEIKGVFKEYKNILKKIEELEGETKNKQIQRATRQIKDKVKKYSNLKM